MHDLISVAVPTRHRPQCMKRFFESYQAATPGIASSNPHITVLLDAPNDICFPDTWGVNASMQKIEIYEKSSLTELWNWGIITAPTDWVLLCNDDIVFKPGWLQYLEQQIHNTDALQINLGHYGAFCMHKSLVLRIGWHDERYMGGGYEDIDWQLRIAEAGLKDRVDNSHTFYENRPGHDVGHFIDHFKSSSNEGWQGRNNSRWICMKWSRRAPAAWNRAPSIRTVAEPDWHPAYTFRYVERFNMRAEFADIGPHNREVYP